MVDVVKKRVPWNKGLTKETSPSVAKVAESKAKWWAENDTTETRAKIGASATGRIQGGEKHPAWKGGRFKDSRDGYVYLKKEGWPTSNGKGYVLEHRYVMEKELGRSLTSNEEVHHINGIKDDNRVENLKVVVKSMHFGKCVCPHCQKEFEVK